MKLLLTGGTGYLGSAILKDLLARGHAVEALARSDDSAARLADAGADVHRGDLTDPATLEAAAAGVDGVIHTAFGHDFARYAEMGEIDREAIDKLIHGLIDGGGKVLVTTSVTTVAPAGVTATEVTSADDAAVSATRAASERVTLAAADRGVRSAAVRLPPSVHGPDDRAFVPMLMDLAERTGVSAYLGDGRNRWPAVHRDDAARLYVLAVEKLADGSLPPGSLLHGVADEAVPFADVATAIADRLGLGEPEPRAADHFGWLGTFAGLDNPATSATTRRQTGWHPTQPSLLDDVRGPSYACA